MTKNSEDRRVKKTRKILQESLATLLSQNDLPTITIRALSTQADVHRSTFYAHYEDIYALYHEIEDQVIVDLTTLMTKHATAELDTYYQLLFNYVDQNRLFCKMLFSNHAPHSFLERLTELFQGASLVSWAAISSGGTESLAYLAAYHVQGCFSMVQKWTATDFKLPKAELTEMIAMIDQQITNVLQNPPKKIS